MLFNIKKATEKTVKRVNLNSLSIFQKCNFKRIKKTEDNNVSQLFFGNFFSDFQNFFLVAVAS